MEFYTKLPRNKKEFALFMAVISVISVNIIAPLITFFEVGFTCQFGLIRLRLSPSFGLL